MTKELDNIQDKVNWHWRNSMYPTRFFGFESRAAMPLPLLILHLRPYTFVIFILSLIAFRILENLGLTFPAAVRNFRAWLVGKNRPGWIGSQRKLFLDYY